MQTDIPTKVRRVLAESLCVSPEKVTDGANLIDDLGADSLDVIEIAMGLEDEFDIDIPDDDFAKLATVGDVVAYLDQRVAA